MSSVNYSVQTKGAQLVKASEAWKRTRTGKYRLNPMYQFVGRMETSMPNMVITATPTKQPSFKEDVSNLSKPLKNQVVKHFYDENGKRNRRRVVYFAIPKDTQNTNNSSGNNYRGENGGKKK